MSEKREFTGVFIPAHIWESKELIPAEKMILGEIENLSKKTGWCTASRAHFAEWLSCSLPNVSYYFEKLQRLGFIQVEKTPGFRSKIRLISERFYISQVVNWADGGSKRGLRVVVNGADGGSKRGLPEIKDKYNNKIKGEREGNAPALKIEIHNPPTIEIIPLEAEEKKQKNVAPGAPDFEALNGRMGITSKDDSPENCEALIYGFCDQNPETIRAWYSRAFRTQTKEDLQNIITAFVGKYGSERNAAFLADPARFWNFKGAVWIKGQKQYDPKPANGYQQKPTQSALPQNIRKL